MVGNMYKVIQDYEPSKKNQDKTYFLRAEKGDILIDCEIVDEQWFRGKNMMSEKVGKIPKSHVEAFSSNNQDEEDTTQYTTYEDIDADFSSPDVSETLLIKRDEKEKTTLTSNPLLDAVDHLLNKYPDSSGSSLAKYREANYVDMSSGETINTDEPSEPMLVTNPSGKSKPPPKPRRSVHDIAKNSDDGYNSGSHYSGEHPDQTSVPLLQKVNTSRQDEAGYEVPHNVLDPKTKINNDELCEKTIKENKTIKSKFMKFRRKTPDGGGGKKGSKGSSQQQEDREKFYNPPVDLRDFYFLPKSDYPAIRVLLCFIAALGLALGLFLVLYILCGLHPVLCFTLAAIIFIAIMTGPSTLLNRGLLCITCLLLPSLASTRTKVGLIILLCVLLICGPILGTVDKISFSMDCHEDINTVERSHRIRRSKLRYPVATECTTHLKRVKDYCLREWTTFRYNCDRYLSQNLLNIKDKKLCLTDAATFCRNDSVIKEFCHVRLTTGMINQSNYTYLKGMSKYGSKGKSDTARDILLYLLPLLFLLVVSDAYRYNRAYLCTKNTDNIYITQRLRQLDCERKNRGLTDLIFPLTRIEFHTYLLRNTFALSKTEKENVAKWLVIFMTTVVATVVLVVLDNKIETMLLLILNKDCKIIYDVEKENETNFRTIIYSLIGVLLFVIFVQSHVLRVRNMLCEYFYPNMIDIRSKHLYYKILHDRHTFARHIRRKIQLLAEEKRMSQRISFKSKTFRVLPDRFKWICRKLTIRQCMICDSISYKKSVECEETNCQAHYCYECYVDAGQQCLTCKSTSNNTTSNDRTMSIAI